MGTDINSLNGFSKDLATLVNGNSKSHILSGKAESIFNQVNTTVNSLLNDKNLNFSKVFNALKNIGSALLDFFENNLIKVATFCKKVANLVLEKFQDLVNHSGDRNDVVNTAKSYVGNVNNRKVGNILFSNNRDEEWCADTVTFIMKDVAGGKLPKDFGSASVSGLMQWGQKYKAYANTASMTTAKRNEFILNNIKPGDIMIEKRNKSHTGIVTRVYQKDGVVYFDTIEGNMGSKLASERRVGKKTYRADSSTLSGFVQMGKWLG